MAVGNLIKKNKLVIIQPLWFDDFFLFSEETLPQHWSPTSFTSLSWSVQLDQTFLNQKNILWNVKKYGDFFGPA